MLIREKAEFLKQYDTYEKEAARIRVEVDFWRKRMRECETKKETACAKRQMDYYTRLLMVKYQFCLAARMVIEEAISTCKSPRSRLMLRQRFVDRLTIDAVAEKMELSTRHAMRLYQQALEEMQVVALDSGGCQGAMERAMAWLTLSKKSA